MIDTKIDADGDFLVEAGDLMLTGSQPADAVDIATTIGQLAYFGIKTDLTDFTLHPEIGNESKKLLGLPNKEVTAELGEKMIRAAISSMGITNDVDIESWPDDYNVMNFEVKIYIPGTDRILTMVIRSDIA